MWVNGIYYDLKAEPAWSVDWDVRIGGQSVSNDFRRRLIDISVSDRPGLASDSCSLTLDDADGDIDLNIEGVEIEVNLNKTTVFEGFVDRPRSTGSRGGGRLVPITARGHDDRGKAKQALAFHLDDAPLGDFLGKAAKRAGYELVIDPELAGKMRDYWSVEYESFMDLGQRLAREVNGTFKLRKNKAVLVKRGTSMLNTIYGTYAPNAGGNVINWDLSPFSGRPAFARAEARWFDRKTAKFETKEIDINLGGAETDAVNRVRVPMGDGDQADMRIDGRKGQSKRDRGGGRVLMDLTPEAQVEGVIVLSGLQPCVDGRWRIAGLDHKANRSGGATTPLELKEPGAE